MSAVALPVALDQFNSLGEADQELREEIGHRLHLTYKPDDHGVSAPTWRQLEFHLAPQRGAGEMLLFGGSLGSGKTGAMVAEAVRECREVPRNRVMLARFELAAFMTSTYIELQDQLEQLPRAERVTQNKSTREFVFANRSILHYSFVGGAHNLQRMKSSEWGAIFVEEASEISVESAFTLAGRLRWKPAANVNRLKFRLASNPEQCWLRDRFIDRVQPGFRYIAALPSDNPHLPEEYVPSLLALFGNDPAWVEAYLQGSWDAVWDASQCFPSGAVMAAIQRTLQPSEPHVWGVDVARYGKDLTVVYERRGPVVRYIDSWQGADTWQSCDKLTTLYLAANPRPSAINIDAVGLGAGLMDAGRHRVIEEHTEPVEDTHEMALLAEVRRAAKPVEDKLIQNRLPVRAIYVGEKPKDAMAERTFANVRAQISWGFRNLLLSGNLDLEDRTELRTELTAFRYEIRGDRQIQIEPKEKLKGRLGRSPDHADACILACADSRPVIVKTGLNEKEAVMEAVSVNPEADRRRRRAARTLAGLTGRR